MGCWGGNAEMERRLMDAGAEDGGQGDERSCSSRREGCTTLRMT